MPGRPGFSGNYPCRNFSLLRDAFRRRKSSLGELFPAEGCILQKGIISVGAFLRRGMHFAEGNHPWENFSLQRDDYCRRKSSLEEFFSAEGCSAPPNSDPWQSFFLNANAILRGTMHMCQATACEAAMCKDAM